MLSVETASGLNVGCGPHPAKGWWNTDLVTTDTIRPDQIVDPGDPFPFDKDTFDRVYLGHVLEHVPWERLPAWLAELRRVLRPGGWVMAVGPDALRTIDLYRDGTATRDQLLAVIEGTGAYLAHLGEYEPIRWGGDRHHWNCYEQRVVDVLTDAGFDEVTPYPVGEDGRLPDHQIRGGGWPLVDGSPRQFAVHGRNPA
jgi:SAM-dependent methyltransferase